MISKVALSLGFLAIAPAAFSAPLKTSTNLPLSGDDLNVIKTQFVSDEELGEFSAFITSLSVFPDHTNTDDPLDHVKPKKYYIPPLFQASRKQEYVGTQEIADWGIKVLNDVFDLTKSFDLNLYQLKDVLSQIATKRKILAQLEEKATSTINDSSLKTLKEYANQIRVDLKKLEDKRDQFLTAGANGFNGIQQSFRESVRNQVVLALSQLGVAPTSDEQENLSSPEASKMVLGLAKIISRATNGQFGVRQALFESGYSDREKKWVSIYKNLRKDVSVAQLPTAVTYVYGTAQSRTGNIYSDSDTVGSALIYRGVNTGTKGKCGNTYTCNVVVEYTSLGARMNSVSKTGAVIFPVIFESDAIFVAPEFEGSFVCKFKTGWRLQGRSDVKDGAIIYNGDVYDNMHFSSESTMLGNGCTTDITKGDANSAAYHAIKRYEELYNNLFYERTLKAKADKDSYEKYVRDDLAQHERNSQNKQKSGLFDNLTTWTSAFGSTWGTIAAFSVNSARNFYWHTRVEDTSSIDYVDFRALIKEKSITTTERFTYDAKPLVCWKRGTEGEAYMSACPDKLEYKKQADSDLGKDQKNCGRADYEECVKDVNGSSTNGDGVVHDPGDAWGNSLI